jgi:hypothetical protein
MDKDFGGKVGKINNPFRPIFNIDVVNIIIDINDSLSHSRRNFQVVDDNQ